MIGLQKSERTRRFETSIAPHLAAAYNLARWITRSDTDAEDVVQEACIRAYRYLDGFKGENGRAWLLTIVRNACYTWLERNRSSAQNVPLDEEATGMTGSETETAIQMQIDSDFLKSALEKLPVEFREVLILRDVEGFSYKEIAQIGNIPLGTVMSRIARGRKHLLRLVTLAAERKALPK